jgi:hypothetical protein|tara:strand:+ start:410 stop:658 length:249 start_codon:yes stop_codon:yes gene_type:complete
MEKNKDSKRIEFSKEDMITILRIHHKLHDQVVMLQEVYMKEQQSLFHEQWKVRYLTRRLKAIDPEYAVTEEELDRQIHEKEN